MLVRLGKTTLVATVAVLFVLFAFGNLTDYGSNAAFVQHVLAMDTIFADSTLRWRAITDPTLQTLAYWSIIGWQIATAAVLVPATVRLALASGDAARFQSAKPLAAVGLIMALLLYGAGFTVVGGEWFAMWQSQQWNGLDSANRFIVLTGVGLLVLMQGERSGDATS